MPRIIKTIKTASILTACLAVFLLALPVFAGDDSDKKSDISKNESIFEKHKRIRGIAALSETDQTAPLIKEAKDFALYLNPPPPPPKPAERRETTQGIQGLPTVKTDPPVSVARFDVLATCVNKAKPESSLVLIYENGQERRWVRQSTKVGHITIKEIHNGYVMLEDATRTFRKDMLNKAEELSLLTKELAEQKNRPVSNNISDIIQRTAAEQPTEASDIPRRSGRPAGAGQSPVRQPIRTTRQPQRTRIPEPQISAEEQVLVDKFMSELDSIKIDNPDDPAQVEDNFQKADEMVNKLFQELGEMQIDANEIQDLNQMQIDANETEDINELGKMLDDAGSPIE